MISATQGRAGSWLGLCISGNDNHLQKEEMTMIQVGEGSMGAFQREEAACASALKCEEPGHLRWSEWLHSGALWGLCGPGNK